MKFTTSHIFVCAIYILWPIKCIPENWPWVKLYHHSFWTVINYNIYQLIWLLHFVFFSRFSYRHYDIVFYCKHHFNRLFCFILFLCMYKTTRVVKSCPRLLACLMSTNFYCSIISTFLTHVRGSPHPNKLVSYVKKCDP